MEEQDSFTIWSLKEVAAPGTSWDKWGAINIWRIHLSHLGEEEEAPFTIRKRLLEGKSSTLSGLRKQSPITSWGSIILKGEEVLLTSRGRGGTLTIWRSSYPSYLRRQSAYTIRRSLYRQVHIPDYLPLIYNIVITFYFRTDCPYPCNPLAIYLQPQLLCRYEAALYPSDRPTYEASSFCCWSLRSVQEEESKAPVIFCWI